MAWRLRHRRSACCGRSDRPTSGVAAGHRRGRGRCARRTGPITSPVRLAARGHEQHGRGDDCTTPVTHSRPSRSGAPVQSTVAAATAGHHAPFGPFVRPVFLTAHVNSACEQRTEPRPWTGGRSPEMLRAARRAAVRWEVGPHGRVATTGPAAWSAPGPRRRVARPSPPGRLAKPAGSRPRGGLQSTPPSRLSSPRLGCRPGGCWSCWSRRWTATSRSSVRCGRPPGHRVGSPVAASAVSARIAGRVSELATVRRHLTAGEPGLLLVTGEAGIGKTRLVDTASAVASDQVFVAAGSCLPLSTDVPLLPIADRPAGDPRRGQRAVAEGGPDRHCAVRVGVPAAAAAGAGPDRGGARRAGRRVVAAAALHGGRRRRWPGWPPYGRWPSSSRTCTGRTRRPSTCSSTC